MAAVISSCGKYRYYLDRDVTPIVFDVGAPRVAWIMVNPSTADATHDDATIRKVRGFTQRMNGISFTVGNLFSYRAKDVRELKTASCPTGPDDDFWLHQIIAKSDKVIVAWGPMAKLPKDLRSRFNKVVEIAGREGHKLYCLGTAKDGHPLHPLMQPYSAEIREWTAPNAQQGE
jgi:hypothetical protein